MTVRFARALAPDLLTVLAACGVAPASTTFLENTFQTVSPQSIYGPGPAPSVGVGPRFDGLPGEVSAELLGAGPGARRGGGPALRRLSVERVRRRRGHRYGLRPRYLHRCWPRSARKDQREGRFHLVVPRHGDVTATIPVQIGLELPSGPILPGQSFKVSSSYAVPQ